VVVVVAKSMAVVILVNLVCVIGPIVMVVTDKSKSLVIRVS
jgi:hypothetical protein